MIPSHIDIRVNEEVNKAAKEVLEDGSPPLHRIPPDLKRRIKEMFDKMRQKELYNQVNNKLHKILPVERENVIPKGLDHNESMCM